MSTRFHIDMSSPDDPARLPAPIRLLGDGYAPHVDDVGGALIYSLSVESGFVTASFAYPIDQRDLDVLRADPYRRAVLGVVAHTILQRSMLRGHRKVSEEQFRAMLDRVLHTSADELVDHVATIARRHNIVIDHYVQGAMARQARASGAPPCA